MKQTVPITNDISRTPIRQEKPNIYRVTDDFARPVGIPPGCIAVIMALLGDRLDRILFEEDHD